MAQPPRQRSGFWGGCLVGGCLVVILEFVLVIGAGVLLGAAASRTLSSVNSSLQGVLPSSEPCTPHPCAAHNGLVLLVSNVNRNAGPGTAVPPGQPALHRVRLDITFVAQSGDHDVTSAITLRDGISAIRPPVTGTGCGTYPSGSLTAGQKLGPSTLCFDAAGNAGDALNLDWVPGEGGSLAVLELKL